MADTINFLPPPSVGTSFDASSSTYFVSYKNAYANYSVIRAESGGYTIVEKLTTPISDTFTNIQRIHFADKNIAVDLAATESAGETALMIGAAFGKAALDKADYVGIGLQLFDGGQTLQQVAQLCVGTGLISAPDNTSFVKAVWLNVIGSPIDPGNLSYFTGLLSGSGGTMSQADLLVLAATTQENIDHIGLVGLQTTGLAYL